MNATRGTGGKRARTREKLMATAIAVVQERGFVGASLDEIAARAGMTKGAIYSNFGGKAELMLATMKAHSPQIAPTYTPGAPLRVHLRQFAEALARELPSAEGRAGLAHEFQLYVATESGLRTRVAEMYAEAFAELSRNLEHAHGERLAVPAASLALACQALGLGFVHQSLLTPRLVTKKAVIAAFEILADGAAPATVGKRGTTAV